MAAPSAENCISQSSGSTEKVGRSSPLVAQERSGEANVTEVDSISSAEQSPRKESSSEDKEELETEVSECSPCRRYEKGKEKVQQRHVPGIDETWMAMDLEDGVEVLWNEVHLNDEKLKSSKNYVESLTKFFDQLVTIDHPNIVKFHKYWRTTTPHNKIVFVTEYMFSGSLKQFLKKCKTGNSQLTIKTWTRWCTEILGALNYLHGSQLVHADISTDTIFVHFNGLIKLGRISPYTIIKSEESNPSQWGHRTRFPAGFLEKDHRFRTAYDLLCFGYVALEMADVKGVNGDNGSHLTPEAVEKRLQSLNDPHQKDLIKSCLKTVELERPTAHQLLFHRAIFEVPSLKLFGAHSYICSQRKLGTDTLPDLSSQLKSKSSPSSVFAKVIGGTGKVLAERKHAELPSIDIEKLLENVRLGVDPVSVFTEHNCDSGEAQRREKIRAGQSALSGMASQVGSDGHLSDDDALLDDDNCDRSSHGDKHDAAAATGGPVAKEHVGKRESRRITQISVSVKPFSDQPGDLRRELTILLRMDDRMNRQLSGQLDMDDSSEGLADELVSFGLVNPLDRNLIVGKISAIINTDNTMSPSTIVHFDSASSSAVHTVNSSGSTPPPTNLSQSSQPVSPTSPASNMLLVNANNNSPAAVL